MFLKNAEIYKTFLGNKKILEKSENYNQSINQSINQSLYF